MPFFTYSFIISDWFVSFTMAKSFNFLLNSIGKFTLVLRVSGIVTPPIQK